MSIIYNIFGTIMRFIYENLSFMNYGVAIILFTVFTKLILLPLTVKQIRSSGGNAQMQQELAEIQKLFKGDRERIAEETQKLYQKYNFSPVSGCLPTLIQFPIIIALYAVVREPVTYILSKPLSIIEAASQTLGIEKGVYYQLQIMEKISNDPGILSTLEGFKDTDIISFNFLGVNLGMTPSWNISTVFGEPGIYLPLLLIPVLAAVTTYIQSVMMTKMNKTNAATTDAANAGMMKGMNYMMPVMILFFAFSVPASMGLYWIIGNIFQICSQYIIRKFFVKKDPKDGKDRIIEAKGKRV